MTTPPPSPAAPEPPKPDAEALEYALADLVGTSRSSAVSAECGADMEAPLSLIGDALRRLAWLESQPAARAEREAGEAGSRMQP